MLTGKEVMDAILKYNVEDVEFEWDHEGLFGTTSVSNITYDDDPDLMFHEFINILKVSYPEIDDEVLKLKRWFCYSRSDGDLVTLNEDYTGWEDIGLTPEQARDITMELMEYEEW